MRWVGLVGGAGRVQWHTMSTCRGCMYSVRYQSDMGWWGANLRCATVAFHKQPDAIHMYICTCMFWLCVTEFSKT